MMAGAMTSHHGRRTDGTLCSSPTAPVRNRYGVSWRTARICSSSRTRAGTVSPIGVLNRLYIDVHYFFGGHEVNKSKSIRIFVLGVLALVMVASGCKKNVP